MADLDDATEARLVEFLSVAEEMLRVHRDALGTSSRDLASSIRTTNDHGTAVRSRLDALVQQQRDLLTEIRGQWKLRIDETAKAAGEAQAQAFGAKLTAGLQGRLAEITDRAEQVTRTLHWRMVGILVGSFAGGLALTIAVALWLLTPNVRGLSAFEVQMALLRLEPCTVNGTDHVCAEVDSGAQLVTGRRGALLVPIKGT